MIHSLRQIHLSRTRPIQLAALGVNSHSRSAQYRRLHLALDAVRSRVAREDVSPIVRIALSPYLSPFQSRLRLNHLQAPALRSFSLRSAGQEEKRKPEDVRDPPRRDGADTAKEGPDPAKASSNQQQESSQESTEDDKSKKEEEQKAPPPPPPPHGDKTPWQVFVETLRTEFKASKEWNESTKALASSAHQFTENESIRRAKAAYDAASGAATNKTASALKSTGKVIGKGAAWTWETPVVKGVRAGVNATGKGLDKVTKPVRETAAFKSVKEVIDDGSSSKYGGWIEKEERRKKRELRELQEAQASGRPGKRIEKIVEDPKYVHRNFITTLADILAVPVPTSLSIKMRHGKSRGRISRTPIE